MIVCAGRNEFFSFATPIGVGLVESAMNLTKLLLTKRVKNLLFVGTAGLYKDGEILEIYESSKAYNHEISEILGLSYSPISMVESSIVSRETMKVNSSNYITTDERTANKFSNLGYFMENMEFYSVLKVANSFSIPAFGLFCATNFCNKEAHKTFIKNHKAAKEKIELYVKERLYDEKFL